MRFSVALAVAAAGLVSAQTATTTAASSGSTCAAQNIVDSCLATTKIPLDACAPNDWQCMCDAQTQVVTCYNNCPGDQDRFAAEQQQTSWCNAAKQLAPSSSSKASTLATSATSAASVSSSTASSTKSSASASSTSLQQNAAGVVAPATGLLAVALSFFGLM
ncbi:uncharacterized protein PV09_09054 [Verruconis gallopava]|uniref:Extracellular membrane protein CFEM domain-containing protein n=1 Tax=Verruconis gallopava TaxID=253628 RepID=A0A0D1YEX3_9PEZI|nr:uncharacterized protein PV09_09054 [Verruconis gallopava]KIV99286.1 hypothetical protein PV09_09054 [Verruconis gallopava]